MKELKALKEKKKADAQEEIRKKKIELAQRQAALKAKKATESKVLNSCSSVLSAYACRR